MGKSSLLFVLVACLAVHAKPTEEKKEKECGFSCWSCCVKSVKEYINYDENVKVIQKHADNAKKMITEGYQTAKETAKDTIETAQETVEKVQKKVEDHFDDFKKAYNKNKEEKKAKKQ